MITIPPVIEIKSVETIIAENTALLQSVVDGYEPSESDYYLPVVQAFSMRELQLRQTFVMAIANAFWMTAIGEALDWCASFFEVERLPGSKPYTEFTFELTGVLSNDYTIEAGLLLTSSSGSTATLIEDVVIPAGQTSGTGTVELDSYVESSSEKVEQIATPLPYLAAATQSGDFIGGSAPEEDDELRGRIALAIGGSSTAGPGDAYKALAFAADERIDDVAVYTVIDGQVEVIIHALSGVDAEMITRVDTSLDGSKVRPLTDHPVVTAATGVDFAVAAVVTIEEGYDTATVLNEANAAVTALVKSLKIGESLSLARIIGAIMKVDGVTDVTLTQPASAVEPAVDQVGNCTSVEVVNV